MTNRVCAQHLKLRITPSTGVWLAGWSVVLRRPDLPLMRAFRGAALSTVPGLGHALDAAGFSLHSALFETPCRDRGQPRLSCVFQGCRSWKRGRWVWCAGEPCGCPDLQAGGLDGRAIGPSVPGEAAPGPLRSLALATAEAYPPWVWPAHPAGRFAWSMPLRDRVQQQGAAVTPGGAGPTVRAAFSEFTLTAVHDMRVLAGRTGGPGCHGGRPGAGNIGRVRRRCH